MGIPYKQGGGAFIPSYVSKGITIVVGTGDLVTLTPPPGERVMLLNLTAATTTSVTDVSVYVDGAEVTDPTGIFDDNIISAGHFTISTGGGSADYFRSFGVVGAITGGIDEVIKIVKGVGNTSAAMGYSYAHGVIK